MDTLSSDTLRELIPRVFGVLQDPKWEGGLTIAGLQSELGCRDSLTLIEEALEHLCDVGLVGLVGSGGVLKSLVPLPKVDLVSQLKSLREQVAAEWLQAKARLERAEQEEEVWGELVDGIAGLHGLGGGG